MKRVAKYLTLFIWGGFVYSIIELLWRGYTHWSMFVAGGVLFLIIGGLNSFLPWSFSFLRQCMIGACIITLFELIFGLILNVWLGLGVWDYSHLPFNLMGQICLGFSIAWIAVSGIAIVLDDYLRYWLFDDEKPHYKIIGK